MKEIVFAGYGGQGVLTAGLLISDIAVGGGENATWMPAYGSAMRGGTANCTVKYGKEYIYNPSQEEADALLAMNTQSFELFIKIVKPCGIVLISELVECDTAAHGQVSIVRVPCAALAREAGSERAANVVMAGAMLRLLGDFTPEQALPAVRAMFSKKGKESLAELNIKAFQAGYTAARANGAA